MITVGILVSYLVALLILKVAPGSAGGLDWRLILGIGAIPALVAVALRARMPESPRWLMLHGRYADTAKAFGLLGMDVSEEQAKQAADELAQVEQARRRTTAWTAHREPAGRLARVGRCPRPGGDGGVRHRRQRQRSRRQGRGLRRPAAERERPTRFAAWFGQQWGERAPSRWNVALDAVRSAAAYWSGRAGSPPTRHGCSCGASRGQTAPGRYPAPTSSSCSPARTSGCESGPCGGCCTRPPHARPRCSRSTSRTWTSPTAGLRSAVRAARSTSSSGRPEPPGSCHACSRAASPGRYSSPSGRPACSCPRPT